MESRVARVEGSISDMTRRIDTLQSAHEALKELSRQERGFMQDIRAQEREHLDEKFSGINRQFHAIEKRLESLQGVVNRVGWAIAGSLLAGVVTFAFKGGLVLPA